MELLGLFITGIGIALILACSLQQIVPFETFVFALMAISGFCIMNYELFNINKNKIHIAALLSFICAMAALLIAGGAIPLGGLTYPLILIFSLFSLLSGMTFIIKKVMNRGRMLAIGGMKLALTGLFTGLIIFGLCLYR